jgi:uncharacterized zinc-type alcohol dehydrogenase-like protein
MSNTIKGFAIMQKGGKFEQFEWNAGELKSHDVEIKVTSCGICHSDLSMVNNDWGNTQYPFVGGHEVYGTVARLGPDVKSLKVGQRVGLGWGAEYCGICTWCRRGDDSLCEDQTATIVNHHGGFANLVRCVENAVIPIPDGYEGDEIGPLFCGGITVFGPILEYAKPEFNVGVIGMGGLGSMAVQFLADFGCNVTAFTSTPSKAQFAKDLGARDVISSVDEKELNANTGRFDLIISTVNVKLNWNLIIGTLNKRGRLHVVGAVLEDLSISIFPMLMGHRTLSASPTGSVEQMKTMLAFAKRHNIKPAVTVYPFDKINEAFEALEKQPQGRFVLKW